ncbi:proline dehydrogenase [Entomophthora muscae]|uniref:Proline dehydrogenase n=1 Tax=Entomophthora muscae TaxID=34485 RepID=A0ACC2TZK1_9FUNG|nr:proline dehydrogenase [Entomophthora muscae]
MIKLPVRPTLQRLTSAISLPRAHGSTPVRLLSTAAKRPTSHLKTVGLAGAAAVGAFGLMALGSPNARLEAADNMGTDRASLIEHADPSVAFENKDVSDLLLSLFVYKLCSLTFLTDASPAILSILETLHLSTPAYWVIKRTIFKHFCGGEDREDVVPFMRDLQKANIGSILDFSIEADLPAEGDTRSAEEVRADANAHADFVCDQYRQAVTTASALPGSFIAVKVTGLVNPQLLEKATSILHFMRAQFIQADDNSDGLLTTTQFRQIAERLPGATPAQVDAAVSRADPKRSGQVDWISFLASLSMVKPDSRALYLGEDRHYNAESADCHWDVGFFSPEERADLDQLMNRLSLISKDAVKTGVRLMIDAEQSYFQACIDLVANELSQHYNKLGSTPVIYNTYQMYLKESYEKMRNDLIHAKRSGWSFGAKIVRGAYMVSERKRAADLGVPDIIQDTIDDTHCAYNGAVDLLLGELAANSKDSAGLTFMVASHNKDSVVRTCRQMEQLGLKHDAGNVLFGQLMGMHDTTTYALAKQGFGAFKYIPYGPVREVMPYLIRRAQENSSVMAGASQEQAALTGELRRRLLPGQGKPLPVSN